MWLRDHERCCNVAVRDLTAYQVRGLLLTPPLIPQPLNHQTWFLLFHIAPYEYMTLLCAAYQVNLLSKAMRTLAQLGIQSSEERQQPPPKEATMAQMPRQFLGTDGSPALQVSGASEIPRAPMHMPSSSSGFTPRRRLETGLKQPQQAVRGEEVGRQLTVRSKQKMMPLPPPTTGP